jgi:hypothetical protein
MTSGKFNKKVEFLVQSVCSLSNIIFIPVVLGPPSDFKNRVQQSHSFNDVTYYRTHRTEDVYYENQENSVMY